MRIAIGVRKMASLLLVVATSAIAGCGAVDLASFADRPDAVDARQIADTLARGEIAPVAARLDESQRTPDPEMSLKLLAGTFPPGPAQDIRLIGYQFHVTKQVGGSTTAISDVTFESRYGSAYVVTNVVLRRVDEGERRILGLHAQALPASMKSLTAFSLAGKGPIQYAFLLAMLAVALTTVAALVVWFRRRRITRRKWWWLLGILVGAFKLSVNWTTGAFAVQALTIQLFGLAAARDGLVGPWILSFSIPAGAIAFLINARRPATESVPPTPEPAPVDPSHLP